MKLMMDFTRALLSMPKPWVAWMGLLILVNAVGSLIYIGTTEGVVVLLAILASLLLMMAIYKARGFVRLLGAAHIFWVPLVIWLLARYGEAPEDGAFRFWLLSVIVIDIASLILDGWDVLRYLRGERAPTITLPE